MNIAANTEGLIPTLLVIVTVPKIPLGTIIHLNPTEKQRLTARKSARTQIERIAAWDRLEIARK